MTVRDDMLNGHDICHGGFITTLADSAFAFACNSYNELTVASGLTVDFLAPAQARRRAHRRRASRSRGPAAPASTTSWSPTSAASASRCSAAARHDARQAARVAAGRRSRGVRDDIASRPLPGDLEPIERASRDELQALQLERLQWSAAARLRQRCRTTARRSTPRACIPRDLKALADLAKFPFTVKERPARQLSVRHVRGAARAGGAHPRVVGHDRQADRRRLHPDATSTPGPTWWRARSAPPAAGRRHRPRRLRLRPLHRRPRRALRRRARRLHRDPDVGRADREAGPADPAT